MDSHRITPTIDVAQLIDHQFGRLQTAVVVLCSIAAILDGFDMVAIAFAAPSMAQALDRDVASFGAVFGLGAVGLMVGSLVMGLLADRWGRKPAIIAALALIGIFSGLTPFVRTFGELLVIRFLAGVGLGALMPNIIALTSEYSPSRWNARMVTVMFCGVTVGAILSGSLFGVIVRYWSWQGIFYIGAILPFLIIPLFVAWLPESIALLIARDSDSARSIVLLRRLDPKNIYPDDVRLTFFQAKPAAKSGIAGLFADQRALITPLLWLTFFCNLLVWFFLTNWLPAILERGGFSPGEAAIFTVILYTGGLIGGLALGWMVDRWMSFVRLATIYMLAAASVYATGVLAQAGDPRFFAACFSSGFFVGGAQYAINAVAARFYPTEVRSTGVGWALGVGRLGAILGPALGGLLIGLKWSSAHLMGLLGLPMLIAAMAIAIIGVRMKQTGQAL